VKGRPTDDGEERDGAVEDEFDDSLDLDEIEMAAARRKFEQEQRQAWGKWRQDRELNRRKVMRSLVGLVIGAVLAGLLAYGCDAIRGPRQVELADKVDDYVLQPPSAATQQLSGQFEAAGATGPAAGTYRGPNEVVFVAGYSTEIPLEVVEQLLPPVTGADNEYRNDGPAQTCGATADGSRCAWTSGDLVGGTTARGIPPEQLEKITRVLRAKAVR
jgi:hypothetical protein